MHTDKLFKIRSTVEFVAQSLKGAVLFPVMLCEGACVSWGGPQRTGGTLASSGTSAELGGSPEMDGLNVYKLMGFFSFHMLNVV